MKIETRADCIVCGAEIVVARYRTYCSDKCRVKRNNVKFKEYATEWRKKNIDRVRERNKINRSLKRLAKVKNKMK